MRRSYSFSKRDVLTACLLRYFFEYYAADKRVPYDANRKETIRWLKELSGCYLLAGDILHRLVRLYFSKGSGWTTSWYLDVAAKQFDKALVFSRDPKANAWMMKGEYPPPLLHEFHYSAEDCEEIAQEARTRLLRALRHFLTHDGVGALVRELRRNECSPEVRMGGLRITDFAIEGSIDLISKSAADVRIVDWKMGMPVGDQDSLQVFIYGWWASEKYGVPSTSVAVQRVFLGDATIEEPSVLDQATVRRGRVRLIQDIELMKELDHYGRKGNEKAFSPCEQEGVCRQCKYRQVCRFAMSSASLKQTCDLLPALQTT